ncbi:MAG: rod shape-determining protein [Lachnospiraceae bacterium]|nr:rod shape-determining protein [Lachnospiraceae bacterium]
MNNNAFGIDLGTSNIRIYNRADDEIMMEKNMIAIENKKRVFAYGDSAFEMYEKAPGNINITYPLANGVIADINNMEVIIRFFITALMKNSVKPADYYIAVPTDVTEVEKRAFYDLIKESNVKAKKIMVVEKAIADGLGMDIDIKNSQGVLVVDIGFDTTEISILSLGGIVLSRLIKIGGLKFDEAIKNAVRKEFSLFIGGKTAENVKVNLAELEAAGKNAVVYGRDIVTGLPVEREISTDIVNRALEEHFYSIIDNIKVILERTPPELSADIYRHGIYLTGGGSMVNKLAERIANGTGLKVNIAENPQKSVALGLAKIIKDDNYKSVAYSIEGMGK